MGRSSGALVTGAPDGGGVLTISPTVLEEIASYEMAATEGAVPAREGVMQGVFRRRGVHGVRVQIAGEEATFHLTFGVRAGARMPDVAAEVRRRVASAVRAKTGYAVSMVNVVIDHVAFE